MTNIRINLAVDELITDGSPPWQHLYWLLRASTGLAAVCILLALRDPRRYALLLLLVTVVLLVHAPQSNKQYRFVFAVIPLYLMVGADILARLLSRASAGRRRLVGAAALALASAFTTITVGGILNALPSQAAVYQWRIGPAGHVAFLRDQDPVFPVYRYLAGAPGVTGVWQVDRPYYDLPGYYHLQLGGDAGPWRVGSPTIRTATPTRGRLPVEGGRQDGTQNPRLRAVVGEGDAHPFGGEPIALGAGNPFELPRSRSRRRS